MSRNKNLVFDNKKPYSAYKMTNVLTSVTRVEAANAGREQTHAAMNQWQREDGACPVIGGPGD